MYLKNLLLCSAIIAGFSFITGSGICENNTTGNIETIDVQNLQNSGNNGMNDDSHEQAMKRGRALRKRLKLQNQMKKAEKKETSDDVPYTVVPNDQNTVRREDTNQEYVSYNHDENIRKAADNTNMGKIKVNQNFKDRLAEIYSPERRDKESQKNQNYLDTVSSQEDLVKQQYQKQLQQKAKNYKQSVLGQLASQTIQKRNDNLHMHDGNMSDYSTSDDDWD